MESSLTIFVSAEGAFPHPRYWLSPSQFVEYAAGRLRGIQWRIALQNGRPVFEHEAKAGAFTMAHADERMQLASRGFSKAFGNASECTAFMQALERMRRHLAPTAEDRAAGRHTERHPFSGKPRAWGGVLLREHLQRDLNRHVAQAIGIARKIGNFEVLAARTGNGFFMLNLGRQHRGWARSRVDREKWGKKDFLGNPLFVEMDAAQEQLHRQYEQLGEYRRRIIARAEPLVNECSDALAGIAGAAALVQTGKSKEDVLSEARDRLEGVKKANREYELAFALAGRSLEYEALVRTARDSIARLQEAADRQRTRATRAEDEKRRATQLADRCLDELMEITGMASLRGSEPLSGVLARMQEKLGAITGNRQYRDAFALAGRSGEYGMLLGKATRTLERLRIGESREWNRRQEAAEKERLRGRREETRAANQPVEDAWNRLHSRYNPFALLEKPAGAWGAQHSFAAFGKNILAEASALHGKKPLGRLEAKNIVARLSGLHGFAQQAGSFDEEYDAEIKSLFGNPRADLSKVRGLARRVKILRDNAGGNLEAVRRARWVYCDAALRKAEEETSQKNLPARQFKAGRDRKSRAVLEERYYHPAWQVAEEILRQAQENAAGFNAGERARLLGRAEKMLQRREAIGRKAGIRK